MPDGNVENRNKKHAAMLDHDRVAKTMSLFQNLRHTQHPERY